MKNMENAVIILAAGMGTRLLRVTEYMPKCLIRVGGRPILNYQLEGYLSSGCIQQDNIFVVVGYKAEQIEAYLTEYYPKINIIYNVDYATTNNMYSFYLAFQHLQTLGTPKALYINNADCIYEAGLMYDVISSPLTDAIAVRQDAFYPESMKVTIGKGGGLTNIAKTIDKNDSFGVSVDLFKFSPNTAKKLGEIVSEYILIKKDRTQWIEAAFPSLFEKVSVVPFSIQEKKWIEIDNEEDLLQADLLFSAFNAQEKKTYVFDLDETVFLGDHPIPEAIEFLKKNQDQEKFLFLTNNTSRTPTFYQKKLSSHGIQVSQEQIITPLLPLIQHIKARNYTSLYIVANKEVLHFLHSELEDIHIGFEPTRNQAVIITYDTEVDYQKLRDLCLLLQSNTAIDYIATHIDKTCPTKDGRIPDVGSFIELIKITTGREPDLHFGKHNPILLQDALQNAEENVIIVGDRPYTDGVLAKHIDCKFICVLTGDTTRVDIALSNGSIEPNLILQNLGYLQGLM